MIDILIRKVRFFLATPFFVLMYASFWLWSLIVASEDFAVAAVKLYLYLDESITIIDEDYKQEKNLDNEHDLKG